MNKYPGAVMRLVEILVYTPPFGAAAAMTRGGAALLSGYGIELLWIVGLAALLVWLERRPAERRAAESVKMTFESPYDRVAAALGFEHAPLMGWWLRFYSRNSRFKAMILISLPLVAFLTFNFGGRKGGIGLFNAAMGTMPVVTFIATSRFMVNLFGYLGGGYRRCFLLPVPPAVVLRTGSYASMVLSAPFIPAALIAWVAFAPVPFDAREVFMLACSSTTALFVFHALGLFGTLYGPRKGNYSQSLGNDLSLIGIIILIGGVLGCMFGPMLLTKVAPGFLAPANWWMWAAAPVLGAAIYYGSLSAASAAVGPRREYLMAVVEGRAS